MKASDTPASLLELIVRHHAGQDGDDGDVQDRADHQRGDDADRHVALRVLGFLGVRGDGIEADVGEEDDGRPGQHAHRLAGGIALAEHRDAEEADAGPAVGREIARPVFRIDVEGADADDEQHGRHLDADHQGVEAGALLDALDQIRS